MLLDFLLSIKYHKSEKSFVFMNHFITMYKYIKKRHGESTMTLIVNC